jgi:hypothetical protein
MPFEQWIAQNSDLSLCRGSQPSCTRDEACHEVNGRPAPRVRVGHSPAVTARLSAPSFHVSC